MSYVKCTCRQNHNSISCSVRLARRGDNPNKETLIYIPYISLHHQLGIYNQICWELVY